MSVMPIFLMGLMVFQAHYFNKETNENDFDTNYGSAYTHFEKGMLIKYAALSLLLTAPLQIPFILLFSSPVKGCSISIYLIGLGAGHFSFASFMKVSCGEE